MFTPPPYLPLFHVHPSLFFLFLVCLTPTLRLCLSLPTFYQLILGLEDILFFSPYPHLSLSLCLSLPPSLSPSLSLSLYLSWSLFFLSIVHHPYLTHTHTCTHTQTHVHTGTDTHSHSYTHTHTHTLRLPACFTW